MHIGSIASWTAPGADHVHAAAAARHAEDRILISYDPNVRPGLLGDPHTARPLIERWIRVAHVVKASRDDLDWLYPDATPDTVAARWLDLGPVLVVVTDGPRGATLHQRDTDTRVHRPGRAVAVAVAVADTVGAGDAFTAGLLSALIRRGIHSPALLRAARTDALGAALDDAVLVSALTCERVGADPPYAVTGHDESGDGPARPLTPADLTFTGPARS
ncbi:MAG TPA: PfkB family carbohydrate kinase [Actinocrinis sp.]|nr:PfkB family carbohydrate kinase [Actinocrinis sp.]